ncbi:MAG: hypothetical protein GX891_03900 [Clostridiales bacterium]|nr:hypothetical protein [Clostridiales bacterium]
MAEIMNNCFKKAEILAPAGDAESFMAAVHSGADAIYIGLPGFNARQKASAFSGDELKKLVKKAHLFGVNAIDSYVKYIERFSKIR